MNAEMINKEQAEKFAKELLALGSESLRKIISEVQNNKELEKEIEQLFGGIEKFPNQRMRI